MIHHISATRRRNPHNHGKKLLKILNKYKLKTCLNPLFSTAVVTSQMSFMTSYRNLNCILYDFSALVLDISNISSIFLHIHSYFHYFTQRLHSIKI